MLLDHFKLSDLEENIPFPVDFQDISDQQKFPVKDTDIKSKWELLYIHLCVVTSADVIKLMLCDKYE
jgi:hypothetical protein